MGSTFNAVIERCLAAVHTADPQRSVESILLEIVRDPAIVEAISKRTKFASLEDLAIYRSESLTLLAGAFPRGFRAGPHNHSLWSVVGVCSGQEDNEFFERSAGGLQRIGRASVVAPGVLANGADVIHAISNPLDVPLVVLHAYGGDLFGVPRSSWDPETHAEIPYDWKKVLAKP